MAGRKILLIEPNYKNKYPPIGLMKIATYHRNLGDEVRFFKGDLRDLVITEITKLLLDKLKDIDKNFSWENEYKNLYEYVKTGKGVIKYELLKHSESKALIERWLDYYKDEYRKKRYLNKPFWDRVYITTLFTFYWKITVETILFAKSLVNQNEDVFIGGILASLLPDKIEDATGIRPHVGLLDKPGILDSNDYVVDSLPLDYSILEEIDYKYPERDAYYGYMTRGCIRKCEFCAVPKLEPNFNSFISLDKYISGIRNDFGEKRNLLLLDNNVLASKDFPKIIDEIKKIGFEKDSMYVEPNSLDIAIENLKKGANDYAYVNVAFERFQYLLSRLKGEKQQWFYDLLDERKLLLRHTASKKEVLNIYPEVRELYEKYRNRIPKKRYVDFNQGVDARLLNEHNMELLSQIPIKPLRIAFDSMKYEKVYVKAIHLAAKHGIRHLSNYILYNEKDKPEELYQRLEINVLLSEELDLKIHSFPMKYHPIGVLDGIEWFKNRDYLGEYWNRKFIRSIQTILNATKGKIGVGKSFFYEAFGSDLKEFRELLYMPELYILHRLFFRELGYTSKWRDSFNSFKGTELIDLKEVIESNVFNNINGYSKNIKLKTFIDEYYLLSRDDIKDPKSKYYILKKKYDESKVK
ncbi:hypothetical protein KEM09_02540 [Carboxylicivirga mesophila]|uniref:Radical SAM core domain-containing protein n=1 Tax=Carboxylicivirga mesophila TaxID=1166478 RepID=A0ABS5K5R9_9BACT|nr:radical SAM protein [Carboxylicivirga mesophila]MBS2210257.1 hypothetical protein [Carboxylicivirga mesophila]